jgi:alkanesulfonate monooxygenase SsuD/methylene tetrahydromethanopterin reductase-like flavin-dependent oxidoreductase (luciferase family)
MLGIGVQTWGTEVRALRLASAAGIASARAEFCRLRGIGPDHPLLGTALVGDSAAIAARIAEYAAAGVTDLMLGFADFPALGMLERFTREVLPAAARFK